MHNKRIGRQTVKLSAPPCLRASAAIAGKKEGDGPLGDRFDLVEADAYFSQKTWEQGESTMFTRCLRLACQKAEIEPDDLDLILSGDLQNQCAGAAYAMRDIRAPYLGLYGACSTMAESMALAALLIDGGAADTCAALTGSHYCTAERQYRFPLGYGGVRTPTAQWTVTGAGCVLVSSTGFGPRITTVTTGRILDLGVKDMTNMGAAMAPAAYDTLKEHFTDTGRAPADYDLIVTGDLGHHGHNIVTELFRQDGVLLDNYDDCGRMIYDRERQDVHAGGSGCGCSAVVLAGHLLRRMREGELKKLLFAATGALMSPTTSMQKESIPAICHAVSIEVDP
ncbi:MAG: stage V sporulation protein AD [Oscillospiraceae bacterium]|nr:stage V sporulation protein AD [Oscillospiraceae bacterium]